MIKIVIPEGEKTMKVIPTTFLGFCLESGCQVKYRVSS